jgi:hypothetical protein
MDGSLSLPSFLYVFRRKDKPGALGRSKETRDLTTNPKTPIPTPSNPAQSQPMLVVYMPSLPPLSLTPFPTSNQSSKPITTALVPIPAQHIAAPASSSPSISSLFA